MVHETLDGETVIINLETGTYFSLQGSGAEIWELISRGLTLETLVEEILRRHDEVSRESVETSLTHLITELLNEGLITRTDPSSNGHVTDDSASGLFTGNYPQTFEPPALVKYTDMQDLLLLDPIHEVDETGWPNMKLDA